VNQEISGFLVSQPQLAALGKSEKKSTHEVFRTLRLATIGKTGLRLSAVTLDRDSFDKIFCDFALAAVVETDGAGVGMAGEFLDVAKLETLTEKVGTRGNSKGIYGQLSWPMRGAH
jgi:hypothetical protein